MVSIYMYIALGAGADKPLLSTSSDNLSGSIGSFAACFPQ